MDIFGKSSANLVRKIDQVRRDPNSLVKKLKSLKYDGLIEDKKLLTKEGSSARDDAVSFLEGQSQVSSIDSNKMLNEFAKKLVHINFDRRDYIKTIKQETH